MTAFLVSLAAIAGSLLLQRTMDYIDTVKSKNKKITANDILKATNALVQEARSKGEEVYNKALDKLNAVPNLLGTSPGLKQYLSDVKSKVQKEYNKTRKEYTDLVYKLNDVETRASNLANQPDSVKHLMKDVIPTFKTDVENAYQNFERSVSNETK